MGREDRDPPSCLVCRNVVSAAGRALDEGTMRPVAHLANLDLNLLVALRELVRERSVTRAAQRLGVKQPAAGASLARLRRHFGDELLGREHGEYVLTPPGEQLRQRARAGSRAPRRA